MMTENKEGIVVVVVVVAFLLHSAYNISISDPIVNGKEFNFLNW